MANLTIATGLVLSEAGDGTPSNPGITGAGGSELLTPFNRYNMSSAARMYVPPVYNHFTWSDIQSLLTKSEEEISYEDKKTLASKVTRRGRRRPRGILYPRGSYIPYRRRLR
tara:strand:+ start:3045 stop:3380 length:336 start_codon:yes stop_codon:yes gene_type:complete